MVIFTSMLFQILVLTDGIILTGNSNLYVSDPVMLITKQTALIHLTQHRFILFSWCVICFVINNGVAPIKIVITSQYYSISWYKNLIRSACKGNHLK